MGVEPLADVIMRDLRMPQNKTGGLERQLGKLSPAERARRLLGGEDDM